MVARPVAGQPWGRPLLIKTTWQKTRHTHTQVGERAKNPRITWPLCAFHFKCRVKCTVIQYTEVASTWMFLLKSSFFVRVSSKFSNSVYGFCGRTSESSRKRKLWSRFVRSGRGSWRAGRRGGAWPPRLCLHYAWPWRLHWKETCQIWLRSPRRTRDMWARYECWYNQVIEKSIPRRSP